MIFDNVANWSQYFNSSETFDKIYEKLNSIDINTPNGEYRLNDSCYFKVMSYETKYEPTIIESHRKEVDIQVILKGGEGINIYNSDEVKTKSPYDNNIDCQFYESIKDPNLSFKLLPGKMAVFFPQDIHGCQHVLGNNIETIKKIVIKIDEKLFTH